MNNILYPILASIAISLISLVGVVFLSFKKSVLEKILLYLVAFSAGSLLGGAFFHLIPEAIEEGVPNFGLSVLIGFILFFIVEKFLHWHHCHKNTDCHSIKTLSYMNLIGDGVHNFIDGVVIAAAFLTNTNLGLITTLNIALHEIPQEIGDFGVLIHGGFKKSKALMYNLFSAVFAIIGTIFGIILSSFASSFIPHLLPFAAGGFIYIAASDLIPELKETETKKTLPIIFFLILGILFMQLLKD